MRRDGYAVVVDEVDPGEISSSATGYMLPRRGQAREPLTAHRAPAVRLMARSMFYDVLRVSLALNNITANLRRGGEQATMTRERYSYPVSTLGAAGLGRRRSQPSSEKSKPCLIAQTGGRRCRLPQRVDPHIF
jgi:hypothetical protein